MKITLRTAEAQDLAAITALEAACFPPAEAADYVSIRDRLAIYPQHFWLLELDGKIVSMVNGLVTDIPKLEDAMYEDSSLHNEAGQWQMIFGVDTHPDYQKQGLAAMTLRRFIQEAKKQGRKGIVLTCKERLLHYYKKFGFVNEGVSQSSHGGAVWYDMRLTF